MTTGMTSSVASRLLPGALAPPITDQANETEWVWNLYLAIAIAVAVAVALFVLFIVIRFRKRDDELPSQKQYNLPMELLYTIVPFLVIAALFAVTVVTVRAIEKVDDDPDLVVEVTASQWQWQFDYPDHGVRVVGSGEDVPELVLPSSSSVLFHLESLDVVHSFWITAFRFKRDVIPGSPSEFSVDMTDTTGFFPNAGVCAEFCGLSHVKMRFAVRVLEPDEFEAWAAEQRAAGGIVTSGTPEDENV